VLFAKWLASMDQTHDTRTVETYEMYATKHYLPFFVSLDRMTTASCSDYQRARLRRVQAKTVRKELSGLRGFIAWCIEQHHLLEEDAPIVRSVPKRAIGTANDKRRKVGGWVELQPDEAARIIALMPQRGRRNRPLHAYYTVLWETGLRPETVVSLCAPHDYKRGNKTLLIRDEADKARFGRVLPLTDAARTALDSVCPDAGTMFPRRKSGRPADYKVSLRKAARAAGLDKARASRISDYDFRHGRITNWVDETGEILGPGYLAGHKHATTTALYAHARQDMAEKTLQRMAEGKGER
jgi:integrase